MSIALEINKPCVRGCQSKAGAGNSFTIAGRMNCVISLAGRKKINIIELPVVLLQTTPLFLPGFSGASLAEKHGCANASIYGEDINRCRTTFEKQVKSKGRYPPSHFIDIFE